MLQDTNQDVYIDSPMPHQGSLRRPQTPQRTPSPTSTSSEATIKPRPIEPPAYAPYLDSPPLSYHDSSPSGSDTPCSQLPQQPLVFHISAPPDYHPPLTPSRPSYSSDDDDDDVPLAHLLLYSRDAPPAYSTVVRQSYRETLLQHIHPAVMDSDEEAALEMIREDDLSFTIERAVAMAVVMALLVLAGILVGLLFLRN